MDRELEVIRDEMEQTRANLADKLGALETQVRETVSTASETVTSTVEGVKEVVDTVSETVEGVTETFNISKHIEQNPWLAMGIALAAGFAAGQLLGGGSRQPQPQPQPQPAGPPEPPRQQEAVRQEPHAPQEAQAGFAAQAASMLPSLDSLMPDVKGIGETVISGLGGLAVGSVMGVVRQMVANNLPDDWKGEINNLVDQVTRQLGGKPQPAQDDEPKGEHSNGQRTQDKPQEQPNDRAQRSQKNEPAYQG